MVYLALNNIYLALDRVLVIALFNDNCLGIIQITVCALWFHSLCSVIEPDHSFFLLQVPSRQNSFQSSPFPLPLDTLATTLVFQFFPWSESQLRKSKEFNKGCYYLQVKRAFESFSFFSPKKQQKPRSLCMKYFTNPIQVCRGGSIPYLKNQHTLFLLPPLFCRISQLPGQDRQSGKLCQLPHWSFKDTSSHISLDSLRALSICRIFVKFSVKPVYPTMIGKNIWCSDYWKMHFQKKNGRKPSWQCYIDEDKKEC